MPQRALGRRDLIPTGIGTQLDKHVLHVNVNHGHLAYTKAYLELTTGIGRWVVEMPRLVHNHLRHRGFVNEES